MGQLSNIIEFNNNRRELAKIKNLNDEIILFSKQEAKDALLRYIDEELDFFADGITKDRIDKLEERINIKLTTIEDQMIKHIDNKIDKITEKIVEMSINRKIEDEVTKRLEARLKKIKDSL